MREIRRYGRQSRHGVLANLLVVVHSENGDVAGHGDFHSCADVDDFLAYVVVRGEDAAWLRQFRCR